MHFGVIQEKHPYERRVALPPAAVDSLVGAGHSVVIEASAGASAGFADAEYLAAGADVVWNAREVAQQADVLVVVHPPIRTGNDLLRKGGVVAGFLHLSSSASELRDIFRERQATAISFELLQDAAGSRPVLRVLSDIGGQVAITMATRHLLVSGGGIGRLLGGVPGVPPLNVVVLGAGNAGEAAARAALRLGGQVIVLDRDPRALRIVDHRLQGVATAISASSNLTRYVARADILLGAVAIPGQEAPRVLTRQHIRSMRPGSIFVDMSIDAGGCSETSRRTTHDDPVYVTEGVRHICIPNLPAEVAHTASTALGDAMLPWLLDLGDSGIDAMLDGDGPIARACVYRAGKLRHRQVANATGEPVDV